jgi:hypothetical protein
VIGSGCKERYFFRARRKNAVVLLVLQRTANVQRCRAGGIEEVADVCACGSHARTYHTYDRVILSCRGSSKFSPCDSVFASVLGRICNSDAGEMPAEARKA